MNKHCRAESWQFTKGRMVIKIYFLNPRKGKHWTMPAECKVTPESSIRDAPWWQPDTVRRRVLRAVLRSQIMQFQLCSRREAPHVPMTKMHPIARAGPRPPSNENGMFKRPTAKVRTAKESCFLSLCSAHAGPCICITNGLLLNILPLKTNT